MSFGVVDFAPRPNVGPKHACDTCYHLKRYRFGDRCGAVDRGIDYERRDDDGACGKAGNLWEPIPPRIGLFRRIYRYFFGDPQ